MTLDDLHRLVADPASASPLEVQRLASYALDVSGKAADCWVLLDFLAREPASGSYGEAARRLLRQQQAPGWGGLALVSARPKEAMP